MKTTRQIPARFAAVIVRNVTMVFAALLRATTANPMTKEQKMRATVAKTAVFVEIQYVSPAAP